VRAGRKYRTRNAIAADVCRRELATMKPVADETVVIARIQAIKGVLDAKTDRELIDAAQARGIPIYEW